MLPATTFPLVSDVIDSLPGVEIAIAPSTVSVPSRTAMKLSGAAAMTVLPPSVRLSEPKLAVLLRTSRLIRPVPMLAPVVEPLPPVATAVPVSAPVTFNAALWVPSKRSVDKTESDPAVACPPAPGVDPDATAPPLPPAAEACITTELALTLDPRA